MKNKVLLTFFIGCILSITSMAHAHQVLFKNEKYEFIVKTNFTNCSKTLYRKNLQTNQETDHVYGLSFQLIAQEGEHIYIACDKQTSPRKMIAQFNINTLQRAFLPSNRRFVGVLNGEVFDESETHLRRRNPITGAITEWKIHSEENRYFKIAGGHIFCVSPIEIYKFNPITCDLTPLPFQKPPSADVTFSKDGSQLYITGLSQFVFVNLPNGQFIKTIDFDYHSDQRTAPKTFIHNGFAYLLNLNDLLVIDLRNQALVNTIELGDNPSTIHFMKTKAIVSYGDQNRHLKTVIALDTKDVLSHYNEGFKADL